MSGGSALTRRRLVEALLALAAGLLPRPRIAARAPAVLTVFSDRRCAQRLGVACVGALPDAECSVAGLSEVLRPLETSWLVSTAGLRDIVSTRVKADFAAGRVVRVDGWVLAVTEARLCALAALAADAAPGESFAG